MSEAFDLSRAQSHWEGKKYASTIKKALRATAPGAANEAVLAAGHASRQTSRAEMRDEKRAKAQRNLAKLERQMARLEQQQAAAAANAAAANFPTDGSTRWTTVNVTGNGPTWTMDDVYELSEVTDTMADVDSRLDVARAELSVMAAAIETAHPPKAPFGLVAPPAPPPMGTPPAAARLGLPRPLAVDCGPTPDVAAEMALEQRAERMRLAMATPMSASIDTAVAAVVSDAAGAATAEPPLPTASSPAFPITRASYAPKPTASDFARLFGARPAVRSSVVADADDAQAGVATPLEAPVTTTPAEASATLDQSLYPVALDAKQVMAMTVAQLKAALVERGLEASGLKLALTARLQAAIIPNDAEDAPTAEPLQPAAANPVESISTSPPKRRAVRASTRGKEN